MSEPNIESSDSFKKHFESNYDAKVESYIKWAQRQTLVTKTLFVVLVLSVVALVPVTALTPWAPIFSNIVLLVFLIALPCWFGFILYSGRLMDNLKVKEKDILVHFLLHAAKKYEAFVNEKDGQDFLNECTAEISAFEVRLEKLLSGVVMPLKLPDINQLKEFNENVKNKIIPALRQRKDYTFTPQGAKYGEVFVSLARLFFFEKGYGELHDINRTLSEKLKDVKAETEQARGSQMRRLFGSRRMSLPISFVVVALVVLFVVYILRAMSTETTSYWSYVGDNAAPIAVGIFAGWAAIVYVIYHVPERKE